MNADIRHKETGTILFKLLITSPTNSVGAPIGTARVCGFASIACDAATVGPLARKRDILLKNDPSPRSGQLKSKRHRTQPIAVKNTFVSYLLWVVGGFGVLGLHRFYLGRWVSG